MSIYFVILICIITLGLIFLGGAFYMTHLAIHPRVRDPQQIFESELAAGLFSLDVYNRLSKNEVHILSPNGYDLHGIEIPVAGSQKFVIICHGITMNTSASIKYTKIFLDRSYHVLLIDHRHHGISGGSNTTFGYYEKYDLKAWTDWLVGKYGRDIQIGLHGESMGAAIALQNAAIDPRIQWVVADCPYSDLTTLLTYRLSQDYHLPPFPLIPLASRTTRLVTGMSFKDVSPIRGLDQLDTPILWIHGKEDRYIPPEMSVRMYEVKKGVKNLLLVPEARHAESFAKEPAEYERVVAEFLVKVEAEERSTPQRSAAG